MVQRLMVVLVLIAPLGLAGCSSRGTTDTGGVDAGMGAPEGGAGEGGVAASQDSGSAPGSGGIQQRIEQRRRRRGARGLPRE